MQTVCQPVHKPELSVLRLGLSIRQIPSGGSWDESREDCSVEDNLLRWTLLTVDQELKAL